MEIMNLFSYICYDSRNVRGSIDNFVNFCMKRLNIMRNDCRNEHQKLLKQYELYLLKPFLKSL